MEDVDDLILRTDHLTPRSLVDARDAVVEGRDAAVPLQFFGAGTKLAWGGPAGPIGHRVDTKGMDQLLDHNASDLTATVQPGMPLQRLQAALGAEGQWFAVDSPLAHAPGEVRRATVGGIFAAADGGPRRLRYGPIRDLVTGVTVVLSDGTVARSGGTVIKNVAGYDLVKLFCGSLGTLGLVAELHLRLHPLPETSTTLRMPAGVEAACAVAVELMRSGVVASAIDWAHDALWVRLEGRADGVRSGREEVAAIGRRHGLTAEGLQDDDELAAWDRLVEELAGRPGETVLRAATLPDRLPRAARALQQQATRNGVDVQLASHCGLGLHTARLRSGDAQAQADVLEGWRADLRELSGHVTLRQRQLGVDELADVFGPPPDSFGLMRAVKQQLDPANRCAPGRFLGGL